MNGMVDDIFLELSKRFQGPYPTNAGASDWPLRALKLITRLSLTAVATRSYKLFGTIMESKVTQERKMEAARLALDAAYRPKLEFPPPVDDPKHILDFLHYHVGSRVKSEDRNYAISSGMRTIDSASDNPTSRSWTWRMEDADKLLAGLQQSPHPKGFEWWYTVLWVHYGGLDPGARGRVDEIAMNGDNGVDLKRCRIAVEKEIERVKELAGAAATPALEEAYDRLTTFIDSREKVCDELQAFGPTSSLFFSSRGNQPHISHGQLISTMCGIIGDADRVSPWFIDCIPNFLSVSPVKFLHISLVL